VSVGEHELLHVPNPYVRAKLVMEQIIQTSAARPEVNAVQLRYALPKARIGEDWHGEPNNPMPVVAQVAQVAVSRAHLCGSDYATANGTGVRDHLQVMDRADSHVKAAFYVASQTGCEALNLGAGRGCSVLELARTSESANRRAVWLNVVGRRKGGVAELWAEPRLAEEPLGWHAKHDRPAISADARRWQRASSEGFPRQAGAP
jgi:UDP-glucose 4-epimerase